jgi:hypothetical protein
MPLSVTVTYPMPGATLSLSFQVCGTYLRNEILITEAAKSPDRNAQVIASPLIEVTVTKGNVTFGPFPAVFCPDGRGWMAMVQGVGPDSGYTLTATIRQGTNVVSHAIEWIDVAYMPMLMYSVACCTGGPPGPPVPPLEDEFTGELAGEDEDDDEDEEEAGEGGGHPVMLLPLTAGPTPVTFTGKYADPSADDMFGVVRKIVETLTATPIAGGGTHYHVTYRQGGALPGKYGVLATTTDWELADIEVEPKTYVMFHLKRWGHVVAQTSSGLF